jgi:D-arabinose 1-dehydrogenase-like Zn-dependent alcohol dehydrogenase
MRIGFFLREALRSMSRNAVPSFAAMASVLVTVLVLGVFIPVVQATTGAANAGKLKPEYWRPLAEEGYSHLSDAELNVFLDELLKLGGSKVILATAASGEAMSAVQGGLAANGTLLIVGAAESMQVSPLSLLMGNRSVKGWYSGTSIDVQDTLAFSRQTGVRPMNETYPLERVSEAYDRMMSGKARFRVVLTMK